MTTFDSSIRQFLSTAASSSPTPGGGSVAALVAALGASMTSMVANLTQGSKFADVEHDMIAVATQMADTIDQAEALLEADMQSFERYMSALRLPKETDEQKTARQAALLEASIAATEVPLQLARLCLDALHLSQRIVQSANKNVISDLGIAALLLESAGQSALLTVDMNLPSLQDLERKAAFQNERDRLHDQLVDTRNAVVTRVRERLLG
jgi:formiminotetrahydrofolate cyclodeaminase